MSFRSGFKFFALIILCALTMGCASTATSSSGKSVNPPNIDDISKAKVGLCHNPFSFDQATRYVGLDSRKSPQERAEIKQSHWDDWLTTISTYRNEIQSERKEFAIYNIAAFDRDRDNNGLVELWHGGSWVAKGKTWRDEYHSAIPDTVLYNVYDNDFGPTIPGGSFEYNSDAKKTRHRTYGNSGKSLKDVYVINNTTNRYDVINLGNYGGTPMLSGDTMFGVSLVTNQWYNSPNSFIKKLSNGKFVFDINRFNFIDTFGYYPDAKEIYIKITYIFEMSECKGTYLHGNVKEVIVSTMDGKEINRVTF
ncbi:MAG: hypothetical protein CVV11_15975 [Gammaproteobacteria bacterium HGW-Gammaproteobacteria-15]|nr:MAG: hypothetical protein CVV11_15975 [Gammaproteobacteria bacterium HGW-Gammaproteobacteria-15]